MSLDYKYEEILKILIDEIQQNRYPENKLMPSENSLSKRFNVPRIRIRNVYAALKGLGYIYSVKGKGSYSYGLKNKIEINMNDYEKIPTGQFTVEVAETVKLEANEQMSNELKIKQGSYIYKTVKKYLSGNEVTIISISYLPCDNDKKTILENSTEKIAKIEVVNLCKEIKDLFGSNTSNISLLKCFTKSYSIENKILMLSEDIYRSDRFVFNFES